MPLTKPQSQPGFISQATQVQAQGAWYDGNLVRWRFGMLEKMGGWQRLIEEMFAAPIRKMHAWTDLEDYKNLMVATDLGLQIIVNEKQYGLGNQLNLPGGFIPAFGPSTDATKFSATAGSRTVTVKTSAVTPAGATFLLQLPISVGGRILPAGTFYSIKSVTLGVGFTFDMPMPALVDETDTYGIRLYTNDFANGMTVSWKAHGLGVGDAIEVAQTTTLKSGTAIDFSAAAKRLFRVAAVPSVDTFTILMGDAGTGDGTGGVSHQVYEGSVIAPAGTSLGMVIGVAALKPLGNPQKQSWFLDNLGQDGLALATDGPLLVYTPPIEDGPWVAPVGSGTTATAPQKSNGMLVAMPQAQVILWGTEAIMGDPSTYDPLLIRFSDVGTYDKYTAAVANQAGSYRLSRGSKIMGAIQAPQMTLIFTDTDLWSMSYIGPPLIYGFTIVASGCGLDAPHDVGVLGTAVIWKSKKNFWIFGGGGAQVLPCSVWDYAFNNIDDLNINKSFAAPNSSATEIGFWFSAKDKAKEVEKETGGGNLLLFSNDLMEATRWVLSGAATLRPSLFEQVYLYEPQYIQSGWFDDSGLNLISWLDDDVQMQLEQVIFAPDGTDTATLLQEFAINGEHSVAQVVSKQQTSKTYTVSIYAHNSSTRNLTLRAASATGGAYATFDVVTGALVTSGVTAVSFRLISAVMVTDALGTGSGNGWRRYVMTFTSDDKPTLEASFNNTNGTALSYMGDITKGCLIWGPQLVEGSLPLEYQITTGIQIQNEPTLYVKFNPMDKAWDSGALPRTAWIDNSIWGTPLGADANFRVQQHERGYDDDDQPMRGVFAETGYAELGDGSTMLSIHECQPDFKWFGRDGALRVSLRAQNYSGGPDHLYGPWSMTPGTQFFCPRVRARRVAVRYEWEPLRGYSARVGTPSYKVKPTGRRP